MYFSQLSMWNMRRWLARNYGDSDYSANKAIYESHRDSPTVVLWEAWKDECFRKKVEEHNKAILEARNAAHGVESFTKMLKGKARKLKREQTQERNLEITIKILNGSTIESMAEEYDITKARVGAITHHQIRSLAFLYDIEDEKYNPDTNRIVRTIAWWREHKRLIIDPIELNISEELLRYLHNVENHPSL